MKDAFLTVGVMTDAFITFGASSGSPIGVRGTQNAPFGGVAEKVPAPAAAAGSVGWLPGSLSFPGLPPITLGVEWGCLGGWLGFKIIGTRSGGSVVAVAMLVAAAETRATE